MAKKPEPPKPISWRVYKTAEGKKVTTLGKTIAAARAQEVMSVPTKSIIESRRDQMFPVLETADIERMRRFGRLRSFRAGEVLARAGQVADGLAIILAGKVEVSRTTNWQITNLSLSTARGSSWVNWRNLRVGQR